MMFIGTYNKLKDTYQNVDSRQDDRLWISILDNYTEKGQRQDFNDYKLVQGKHLKSLTVTDKLERTYLQEMSNPQNYRQSGQHGQMRSDITVGRMSRLKREMEHLERRMQRIRMTLARSYTDPSYI